MATGVMVSRADKETKFWLACEKSQSLAAVRDLMGAWPSEKAYFGPGLVAEYGAADGDVFTASEVLDLSSLGIVPVARPAAPSEPEKGKGGPP